MLKKALIVLASIGLLDAIYLTWIKLANQVAQCAGIGDCEAVNSSPYSEIAGIPIALLGAAAFLVMLLVLLFEEHNEILRENGPLLVVAISLVGVLYSVYLTYLEIFVIKAICPYCVLSALVLVALLILSWRRLSAQWDQV